MPVDYAALAEQARQAAAPSGAVDYAALAEQARKENAPDFRAENEKDANGSPVVRFAKGAWSVLNPVGIAEGLYQTVRHPLDTATNIVNAQVDQAQKSAQLAKEGRYTEAAGHAAAAALPVIGPAAAHAGERMASGDVAGGLGEGTALLAPFATTPVFNGIRGLTPNMVKEAAASALEEGAARRVTDVMAPKVGANKVRFGNMAEKVAPQVVEDLSANGAPLSREGLRDQMGQQLATAEAGLDAASDARLAARTFPIKPLVDALMEKRKALTAEAVKGSALPREAVEKTSPLVDASGTPIVTTSLKANPIGADVVPSPNASRVAVIDQAINELKQLGPVSRYEPLRQIRQAYDGPAKAIYSPAVTADYLKAQGGKLGAADVTGALREALAKMDPQTAEANAKYSLYKTANDVLDATAEVERTRPRVGRQIIARMTGTLLGEQAAGMPGAVAGYVAGPLVDSALSSGATTQLKTAKLMNDLASAIRGGNQAKVGFLSMQLKANIKALKNALPAAARGVNLTNPSESQTGAGPLIAQTQ